MTTRSRTGLLIMDFQEGIAEAAVASGAVSAAMKARTAAEHFGMMVAFSKVGFQEGYPEIGEGTLVFSRAREAGAFSREKSKLLSEITSERDPVIDKKRFSAFTGSSLAVILRAHDVRDLVLAGVSTSGVVLSTLIEAFELDYRLTVLADACMDPDPAVHELLLRKVFPSRASVLDTDEWIAGLSNASSRGA